jgi:hypothetical protein
LICSSTWEQDIPRKFVLDAYDYQHDLYTLKVHMFPLQAEHGDVAIKVINSIVIRCHPGYIYFEAVSWVGNLMRLT